MSDSTERWLQRLEDGELLIMPHYGTAPKNVDIFYKHFVRVLSHFSSLYNGMNLVKKITEMIDETNELEQRDKESLRFVVLMFIVGGPNFSIKAVTKEALGRNRKYSLKYIIKIKDKFVTSRNIKLLPFYIDTL